jgi:hypothetical protein
MAGSELKRWPVCPSRQLCDDNDGSREGSEADRCAYLSHLNREQMDSLHSIGLVERKENVIVLSSPSVEKTQLTIRMPICEFRLIASTDSAPRDPSRA